jgi:hypothetical protein
MTTLSARNALNSRDRSVALLTRLARSRWARLRLIGASDRHPGLAAPLGGVARLGVRGNRGTGPLVMSGRTTLLMETERAPAVVSSRLRAALFGSVDGDEVVRGFVTRAGGLGAPGLLRQASAWSHHPCGRRPVWRGEKISAPVVSPPVWATWPADRAPSIGLSGSPRPCRQPARRRGGRSRGFPTRACGLGQSAGRRWAGM